MKNIGTKEEQAKDRFVAQGHRDKDKPYMVHDVSTLCSSPMRLILSVAAVKRFRLFSYNIGQDYVQSKEKLSRQIFIRPRKEPRNHWNNEPRFIRTFTSPIWCLWFWWLLEWNSQRTRGKWHRNGTKYGRPSPLSHDAKWLLGRNYGHIRWRQPESRQSILRRNFCDQLTEVRNETKGIRQFRFFGTKVSAPHPRCFFLSQEGNAKGLHYAP